MLIVHSYRLLSQTISTRSVLCQPIRSMRGGGSIIGVVQLLNKKNADASVRGEFDGGDEQVLASTVQKIAEGNKVMTT
jgi:hypothetical protein